MTVLERTFGEALPALPGYHNHISRDFYLPMSDGVPLAVTLVLPLQRPMDARLPTLIIQTRYWRGVELKRPFRWFIKPEELSPRTRNFRPFFTSHGYAILYVDERGTGASYGTWPYPWHEKTVQDAYEIVDWVVSQPWSNGRVGAWGVSYVGTTAELYAVAGHPAVRAVMPLYNHPDPYTDIAFPGGMFNLRFISAWWRFDQQLDQNLLPEEFGRIGRLAVRGVKPVDDDHKREKLAGAVTDHLANGSINTDGVVVTYRDEKTGPISVSMEGIGLSRYDHALRDTHTAISGWASWLDAGTAAAALRRFQHYKQAHSAVIGPWDHGATFHADPFEPERKAVDPPKQGLWQEMLRFLDAYLKEPPYQREPLPDGVTYFTLGENLWKFSEVWPPEGFTPEHWHLAQGGKLAAESPADEFAADEFRVDFAATTGLNNRWWELGPSMLQPIQYSRRREAAAHMLVYHTPTFESDVELTGSAVLHLFLRSSLSDGGIFAYLEDVAPDGTVTYLTEGQLRLQHRQISPNGDGNESLGPLRSFHRADARRLVRGETAELVFALQPISALVRRGHSLRLGLAGHDEGTFQRVPNHGIPEYQLIRCAAYPSHIVLPLQRR